MKKIMTVDPEPSGDMAATRFCHPVGAWRLSYDPM